LILPAWLTFNRNNTRAKALNGKSCTFHYVGEP
jgi:hypothetical protein